MHLQACGRRVELVETLLPTLSAHACAEIAVVLEGRTLTAHVRSIDETVEVHVGDYGAFRCPPGDAPVEILRWPVDAALRTPFLHGPVLLSALARQGIHALHASALRLGPGESPVVALSADSGTGKSTLARAALRRGWERLADDVLPLAAGAGGAVDCLPDFLQLKLAADQQYPARRPQRVPLAAIVQLQRGAKAALRPLSERATLQLVLGATIAARLYPPSLLARHLAFGKELAAAVGSSLQAWVLTLPEDSSAADRHADAALDALRSAIIQT